MTKSEGLKTKDHVHAGSGTALQPTKPWEKYISALIGRKILVLRDADDHVRDDQGKVVIYMTDDHVDQMNDSVFWGTILAVSKKCELFSIDNIGQHVRCPDWGDGVWAIGDGYFIYDERAVGGTENDLQPFVVSEVNE